MLTEKDYCDKDLSLALKEAGYIGQGRCYYDLDKEPNKLRHFGIQVLTTRSAEALNFVLAVHLYDAQKWLREEKDIDVLVQLDTKDIHLSSKYYSIYISYMSRFRREFSYISKNFDSYEEALSEGVREAIEILKER